MKRVGLHSLLIVALLAAGHAARAECPYPKPPVLPNAASATEQQMVEAMAAFKLYDAEVNAYGQCLEQETTVKIKEGGAAMSTMQIRQLKTLQTKKHNAAVMELQAKVKEFNEQVRQFKAKSG